MSDSPIEAEYDGIAKRKRRFTPAEADRMARALFSMLATTETCHFNDGMSGQDGPCTTVHGSAHPGSCCYRCLPRVALPRRLLPAHARGGR